MWWVAAGGRVLRGRKVCTVCREGAKLSRQSRPSSRRQEVKNLCAKQKSPKIIQLLQVIALIYRARLSALNFLNFLIDYIHEQGHNSAHFSGPILRIARILKRKGLTAPSGRENSNVRFNVPLANQASALWIILKHCLESHPMAAVGPLKPPASQCSF